MPNMSPASSQDIEYASEAISPLESGTYPRDLPNRYLSYLLSHKDRGIPFEPICYGRTPDLIVKGVFSSEQLESLSECCLKMASSMANFMLRTPEANPALFESRSKHWYNDLAPNDCGKLASVAIAHSREFAASQGRILPMASNLYELCKQGLDLPADKLNDMSAMRLYRCGRECYKIMHMLTVGPIPQNDDDRYVVPKV